MAKNQIKNSPLRLAAGFILGIVLGGILFFVIVLLLSFIFEMMGWEVSLSYNVAENIWSEVILVISLVVGLGVVYWAIMTTAPVEEEESIQI